MKQNVFAHNEDQQTTYSADCLVDPYVQDAQKAFLRAVEELAAELYSSGVNLDDPYVVELSVKEVQ